MPSLYSNQMLAWLLQRGWVADSNPLPTQTGDPRVIDPQGGAVTNLYEAVKLQWQRTRERPDFLPKP